MRYCKSPLPKVSRQPLGEGAEAYLQTKYHIPYPSSIRTPRIPFGQRTDLPAIYSKDVPKLVLFIWVRTIAGGQNEELEKDVQEGGEAYEDVWCGDMCAERCGL